MFAIAAARRGEVEDEPLEDERNAAELINSEDPNEMRGCGSR